MSSDTFNYNELINSPKFDEKSRFSKKFTKPNENARPISDQANSYASFDDAFIQSDTMTDFKDKLIAKSGSVSQNEDTDAGKINNRLSNILNKNTNVKDKMDKNIDELVSFYENKNDKSISQITKPKYVTISKPAPIVPVKKNNNTLVTIIIIGVVLAILYFAYKMFFQNKNNTL